MNKHKLDILIESEVKPLTKKQIKWLDKAVTGDWYYEDGVVNVNGDVGFTDQKLTSIPVQFGKVTGFFACRNNKLTSLKGSPYKVGSSFSCYQNQLTSLEYLPTAIGNFLYCDENPFILNDKLFEDIKRIDRNKIAAYFEFMEQLKEQIPTQFGVTDQTIIEQIWQSYMNIL